MGAKDESADKDGETKAASVVQPGISRTEVVQEQDLGTKQPRSQTNSNEKRRGPLRKGRGGMPPMMRGRGRRTRRGRRGRRFSDKRINSRKENSDHQLANTEHAPTKKNKHPTNSDPAKTALQSTTGKVGAPSRNAWGVVPKVAATPILFKDPEK